MSRSTTAGHLAHIELLVCEVADRDPHGKVPDGCSPNADDEADLIPMFAD
jgi:hypothetical protein